MKRFPRILSRNIASGLGLVLAVSSASAQSGTWSNVAGGAWGTATNWSGSVIASGIDSLADLSALNITATATVTLDAPRTVGTLKFGDATTASNDWVLNAGTAGSLTLDVTTGPANIQITSRVATINAVIAGEDGINVSGSGASGTIVFGAANVFNGGLTVSNAILQLNNNLAAGTNAITMASGGTLPTRLAINGGVSIANNISFGSTLGATGLGVLQQAGTGQGRINGTINITGGPSAGGHFVGGAAVGNELVLAGLITSSVALTQRDGRVIYSGGGTGYSSLTVTNTVLAGANDGLSTVASLTLGGSGNATLDLNGFNQTLAAVTLGNSGTTAIVGTVSLGAKTLTLNGNFSTLGSSSASAHVINATAGGTLYFPDANRFLTVNDNAAVDDLSINGASINAPQGLDKAGSGTLSLNAATFNGTFNLDGGTINLNASTVNGSVNVNGATLAGTSGTIKGLLNLAGGTLLTGKVGAVGSMTADALSFGFGTNLRMKVGPGGDLITVTNTDGLLTGGNTVIDLNQFGGALANGTYPLINYKGLSPGLSGFVLNPVGHTVSTLVDTGAAIALQVTGNDKMIWDGSQTSSLDIFNENLKRLSNGAPATYIESDELLFNDNPIRNTVDIGTNIAPSKVTFTNTAATAYTVTGSGGFTGAMGLTKVGNGAVVLRMQSSFTGPTTLSEGSLELDFDASGGLVLTGTSGISVAAGSLLKLTRDDGNISLDRALSGSGTVLIDPHSAAGAAVREVSLTGNNTGFTGLWKLSPSVGAGTAGGTFRTNVQMTPTTLGSAAVQVDSGAQLWLAGAQTYPNPITISGTGYSETGGGTPVGLGVPTNGVYSGAGTALFGYAGIGAIRIDGNAILSGPLALNGNAKIMSFGATATVSGPITSGTSNDTLVVGGGTSATTMIFTGTNSYGRTMVNGGSGTSAVTQLLQIGNNSTTGTLGLGEVVLYGNSAATAFLRFSRSDGYTLAPGQNILGAAAVTADFARVSVSVNTTGTGLTLNNNTLDISDGVTGGNLYVAGNVGANGVTGASLNLTGASVVDTGFLYVGDMVNFSGSVNISGTSSLTVLNHARIAHYGTEASSLNISGGSFTASGAAPATFPFATTALEQNGGIYVGVDGTGTLNQSGGVVSTNFVVLDNRTESVGGGTAGTGVDTYALSGGTLLLRNTYGIISRYGTTSVLLSGGTIQAASGASPNLDSNRITVSGPVTMDTNGSSTFSLYGALAGTGTLNLIGAGTFRTQDGTGATSTAIGGTMPGGSLGTASFNVGPGTVLQANRTGVDSWSGSLSGSGTFNKLNTGALNLTGNSSTFSGTVNVSGGRLNLPVTFSANALSVADGAALGGEPTVTNLSLGATATSTLFIDPNTPGALTSTLLTVNGTPAVDFAAVPTGAGPYTVLNYTTRAGAGTFTVANAAGYRVAPVIADTGTSVTVNISGTKNLTWTGASTSTWEQNLNANWKDDATLPDKFFAGDTVVFGDDPTSVALTVSGGVSPWKTSVTSSFNNFTFTSSGNGISGPGSLEKNGLSTLTLTGTNTYAGRTVITGGGTLTVAATTSLGNASPTNGITLSEGGRLNLTTAMDLGAARGILLGTNGGTILMTNAAAQTVTLSGDISGSGPLTLSSGGAGAPVFALSGNNAGFTGAINVNSAGGGASTLRLAGPNGLVSGVITLVNPTAGATGLSTTLDLPNMSVPAGVSLVMNTFLNGTLSYRSQISSSGLSAFNGSIEVNGSSIAQISPATGVLSLNGNITDADNDFTGTLFIRGAGNGVINGKVTLPNAIFAKTDAGIWTINSSGNDWLSTTAAVGTIKLGTTNALSTRAVLTLGQGDTNSPIVDLAGFNQTVGGYNVSTGASGSKTITNSVTATPALLTINQATDTTINALGIITGALGVTKSGPGNLTLTTANNTFNGPLRVEAGTLTASGAGAAAGANGPLGAANVAGRTIAVTAGATLSFASNNVFGNGVGNANLPALSIDGGTLTSTRYNVLGNLTLSGATVTQSSTDGTNYEGFQFRGNVLVNGSVASQILSPVGKANHLGANTLFDVADVTLSPLSDLLVSAPLRDQSGDFASAAGGLTKAGAGTLELLAVNSYTGPTIVSAGTLLVSGSIGASAVSVNGGTLSGAGGILGATSINAGGTLDPGAGIATLNFNGALTLAGSALFEVNKAGLTLSSDLANTATTLTLGGLLKVSASGDTLALGDSFKLLAAQTFSGSFASYDLPLLGTGLGWDTSALGVNGILTVIPEPASPLALLNGLGVLLGLRRFRRASRRSL